MKFIIIGLGNFGATLGLRLVEDGHEVIGVDKSPEPVNLLKDGLTHTIELDTSDELSMDKLPLEGADTILVTIGEDIGVSVTATAFAKERRKNATLIARAISDIHHTILEAMGVDEIIHPEAEFADQLANRLLVDGALKSLTLDSQFSILEIKVPEKMIEKTVEELALPDEWSVTIVTLLKERKRRSIWGVSKGYREVIGVVRPDTTLQASDRLVLFGKTQQIQDMLEAYEDHSED